MALPRTLRGLIWVSPWLIGFSLFLAAPAAMSAYYSLTDYSLLDTPVFTGLANYRELIRDPVFLRALRNTLIFAAANTVGAVATATAIALLLEKRLRGSELVRAIVFAPTLIPIVSACIAWEWLFSPETGAINAGLSNLGVAHPPNWLGDRALALPSLIIMSLWIIGTPLITIGAALKDVPASLYEACDLDGAGPLARLRAVTLPMISPAALFSGIMSLIWSLQLIGPPLIMTEGGPENATISHSMYIYQTAFEYGRMGYACALAWIQVLITAALAGLAMLLSKRFIFYRV